MRYHINLKSYGDNEHRTVNIPLKYKNILGIDVVKINTDANGFICNGAMYDGNMYKNKIIILGDSFVENLYVEENRRFCATLEDFINEYYEGGYNIINAGMSGASLLHLYNLFINKVLPLTPFAVILFPGYVSANCNYLENTYWTKMLHFSPFVGCSEDIIYSKSNNFEDFTGILEIFYQTCRQQNINFIVCTTPYNYKKQNNRMQEMNASIRRFCELNSCIFFDIDNDLLTKNSNENETIYFYDDIHLNKQGSDIIAEILFKKFIKTDLLKQKMLGNNLECIKNTVKKKIQIKEIINNLNNVIDEKSKEICNLNNVIDEKSKEICKLKYKLNSEKEKRLRIKNSVAWKITYPLRFLFRLFHNFSFTGVSR